MTGAPAKTGADVRQTRTTSGSDAWRGAEGGLRSRSPERPQPAEPSEHRRCRAQKPGNQLSPFFQRLYCTCEQSPWTATSVVLVVIIKFCLADAKRISAFLGLHKVPTVAAFERAQYYFVGGRSHTHLNQSHARTVPYRTSYRRRRNSRCKCVSFVQWGGVAEPMHKRA